MQHYTQSIPIFSSSLCKQAVLLIGSLIEAFMQSSITALEPHAIFVLHHTCMLFMSPWSWHQTQHFRFFQIAWDINIFQMFLCFFGWSYKPNISGSFWTKKNIYLPSSSKFCLTAEWFEGCFIWPGEYKVSIYFCGSSGYFFLFWLRTGIVWVCFCLGR